MKKILLVNPASDSLARDKNILAREELRIFTAATAEEGLRIHREETVNLILTELDLPDMGGDALCSCVRQEEALKKVSIVVVCRDTAEETARAKSCGANARLLKPVKPEQLQECVGKFLDVPTRQDCRVLVRAQVYDERGATVLFGTSRNISVSGLLIESDDLLAVGDRISCMFFLPNASQITAVGEVVRTARLSRIMNQYGIKFISLKPQFQREIENFVAASAPAA
jgi:CheY-like chemotaxis protein